MNILRGLHDSFVPHTRNNYTPHALRHRSLTMYAGLMVSVKLLSLFSAGLVPQIHAASAVTPNNILQLTNYSRQVFGLHPLEVNEQLSKAAQDKANDMIKVQYFDHNSPGGKTPWDFIKSEGYNYIIAGENLAINFYSSEEVQNAWMNSPGHKANILNKDFEEIGIGIVQGQYKGNKAVFVVQMFGTKLAQPFKAQVASNNLPKILPAETVSVPVPSRISLPEPAVAGESYSLVNSYQYTVKGIAPNADQVYAIVNNNPQQKLEVISGEFNGLLNLVDGENIIQLISFNSYGESSKISKPLKIKVDTTGPRIISKELNPVLQGGSTMVQVVVESADAARIVANIGSQNIMLQPTEDGKWVAQIQAASTEMFGNVTVKAYDLAGNSVSSNLASIAPSAAQSYGFLSDSAQQVVYFLGKNMPTKVFDDFYAYATLILLLMLTVLIAVKRNVQHVGVIAHTAGVAMITVILWTS